MEMYKNPDDQSRGRIEKTAGFELAIPLAHSFENRFYVRYTPSLINKKAMPKRTEKRGIQI
jgi:hypothetical protein